MLSKLNMFERYKEEKAIVIGSFEVRTGLEDFPSYKEWEEEYVEAWNDTHQVVSSKEADKIFDSLVAEADDELEDAILASLKSDDDEEDETVDTSINRKKVVKSRKVKTVAIQKKAKVQPAKQQKSNKNIIAQQIFDKHFGVVSRKVIISMFMDEAGLTSSGASTYYQRMKTNSVK